jgi:hypothetical protein
MVKKVVPVHVIKSYGGDGGSGGIDPFILKHTTRWKSLVHHSCFTLAKRIPEFPLNRNLRGVQSSLDALDNQ